MAATQKTTGKIRFASKICCVPLWFTLSLSCSRTHRQVEVFQVFVILDFKIPFHALIFPEKKKISVFGRSEVLEIIWVLSIQEVAEAAAGRGEADFKLLISFPSSLLLEKLLIPLAFQQH